jgi:GNAT superfamily N-acetyltransferase
MSIVLRPAVAGDGAALHAMVMALAISHGHENDVTATPGDFDAALTLPGGLISAIIAEVDGLPAGCAIYHRSFSTFRGKETIYLEDLCVLPEFRRRGVARQLLKAVARAAVARGVPAVSWLMMDWNDGARALYESAGAEVEAGNSFCRLTGDALGRLAE